MHLLLRFCVVFAVFAGSIALQFAGMTAQAAQTGQAVQKTLSPGDFDYTAFRQIPILHEGRVKPLESYARASLLLFSGRSDVEGLNAIAWLAELLFDQERAYKRQVFNIVNPDVLHAVGLSWRQKHRYSHEEVSQALGAHMDTVGAIYNMPEEQRTLAQRQLLNLYFKMATLEEMSHSLTLIQPRFEVADPELAKELGVPQGRGLTYLDLMPAEAQLMESAREFRLVSDTGLSAQERESLSLALAFMAMSRHRQTVNFRIMPPQWEKDGELWLSPWATFLAGRGSPQKAAYLKKWKMLAQTYIDGDAAGWTRAGADVLEAGSDLARNAVPAGKLKLETVYHRAAPFQAALALYLASVLLLAASLFHRQVRWLYSVPAVLISCAAVIQSAGIVLRMVIMGRPPVTTLYETTLFVSLIAVVLSLAFERRRRNGLGLIVAGLIGSLLLLISLRYAADGDTMEMLVAVLDTNFWLATHVVTITIGYGCCLVAGTYAHIYLLQRFVKPADTAMHAATLKTILAVGLIALFFSLLGTILGGIWADQSWGRFWGWDPKENGAMWIVLWLLWCFHGRIAGILSPLNFASLMVVTNVIVALAWFGVNLLSVGLHSYGFTDNIAVNLALFCGAEILFAGVMRAVLLRHERLPQ